MDLHKLIVEDISMAEKIQLDFLNSETQIIESVNNIIKNDYSDEEKKQIIELTYFGFKNFEQARKCSENEKIKNEFNTIEKYKPIFKNYKFISLTNLIYILNKYDLCCKDPQDFTSEIPLESLKYLNDIYCISEKEKIGIDLRIVAPESMFDPSLKTFEDPVILGRIRNTPVYIVIYAWGVEKNILNNEEII